MSKKHPKNEVVTKDYLDQKLDEKFEEFARIIKKGFDQCATKVELNEVKKEVKEIKDIMVTKDFLEDKMADLEGSVILRQRKEDKRFKMLTGFLSAKKVIEKSEISMLQGIKVFPSLKN